MFLSRLSDQLSRWIKATEMDLQELILLEQFLKALPRDLAVWLREQKPTCATKAAEMADDYEVARKSEDGVSGSAPSQKPALAPQTSSHFFNHREVKQITEGRYSVIGVRNGDTFKLCAHKDSYSLG